MKINNHVVRFGLIYPFVMSAYEIILLIEFNAQPESMMHVSDDGNAVYVQPNPAATDILFKVERLEGLSFSELDADDLSDIINAACENFDEENPFLC